MSRGRLSYTTSWDTIPGSKFTPGSVGNGASHLNIWKVVAGGSEPTMVFEDDAIIRDDISSTLPSVLAHVEDWDVVLLGYNTDSVLVVELNQGLRTATLFSPPYPDRAMEETFQISRSPVGLFKLHNCFGTCGYIISPSGARRLLDLCGTLDNRMIHVPALNSTFPSAGLDCSMNSVYKEISAYACFAPLVLPRNQRSMSTIQTADAKIWM